MIINSLTGVGGLEKRFSGAYLYLHNEMKLNNIYLLINENLAKELDRQSINFTASANIFIVPQRFSVFCKTVPLQILTSFYALKLIISLSIGKIHMVSMQLTLSFILTSFPFVTTVQTFANTDFYSHLNQGLKRFIFKKILKNLTKLEFLSDDIFKRYQSRYPDLWRTTNNFISPCSFTDNTKYYLVDFGHKEDIIVFLSRLTNVKNADLFIESINEIVNVQNKSLNGFKIEIYGRGEEQDNIERLIKKYHLQEFVSTGYTNVAHKVFRKSKIFVSIQSINNYPSQSLLESMSCGNAILASNKGETHLLVDEDNGVLVELNSKEIAAAIVNLIQNQERLKEMGKNSNQKIFRDHNINRYCTYLKEEIYT